MASLPTRLVALAACAQLTASLGGALVQQQPRPTVSFQPVAQQQAGPDRATAVRALLQRRAAAVLTGDANGFLATVDPRARAFRARQAAVFSHLRGVPLASWSYALDATHQRPGRAGLDQRYGAWWAPDVVLRYAVAGFDRTPTERQQGLTFVQRDGRWLLAADDDFPDHRTDRELWDAGPVIVTRGRAAVLLAHPGHAALVRTLLRAADAAVPRVTRAWGRDWSRRVVLELPGSGAELSVLAPDAGDLSQIAAVATADLRGRGYHPTGDRVLLHPTNITRLGPLGLRVVLTHEITHVASRLASGPAAPSWLVEGQADQVAYDGLNLPVSVSAHELQGDVRAGRLPSHLPDDAAFDGNDPALAQAYEQAWLAVVALTRSYGRPAVLRLYRAVGAGRPLGQALRELGTTEPAFTARWRDDLRRELG